MKSQMFYGKIVCMGVMLWLGAGCAGAVTPVPPPPTVTPAAPLPADTPTDTTTVPVLPTAQLSTIVPITVITEQPAEFVWTITGAPYPLARPIGVAVDAEENVYVVDARNSRVLKFDRNGKFLLKWGAQGSGDGQFIITTEDEGRLAVDAEGNVYVADTDNHRIQKFDRNGKFLTKWGTEGSGDGQFLEAADIALDEKNDVYVTDMRDDSVKKFDSNGKFLLQWGSPGFSDGDFHFTYAVALDGQGNVLVTDDSNRLQKFDGSGKFVMKYDLQPVDGKSIQLWKIATDSQGNIYVADHDANRIVKLDKDGNFLATWGSKGSGEGQFDYLSSLAVDKDGNIYVTDTWNKCVQKFRQPPNRP